VYATQTTQARLFGWRAETADGLLGGMSKLEGSSNLQLEVDVARRLGLAVVAHIYSVLPFIVRYNYFAPSYDSCRCDGRKPALGGRDEKAKGTEWHFTQLINDLEAQTEGTR
jgi:hypothetical protein